MTSQLTKSTSPSENGKLGSPMNNSTVAFLPGKFGKEKSTTGTWCSNPRLVLAIVTVIILLLALVIVLIILLTVNKTKGTVETNGRQSSSCTLSYEAKRIGLGSFLNELERRYYELMPEKIGFKTDVTTDEVRKHYRPYDPHPNAIKNFTDQVRKLYDRLEVIVGKANGSLLTMRENKGMYLAQFLLMNSFDWGPYQRDYYAGDWMFEPNLYCWQPICDILTNLEKVILRFQPKNLAEMEAIEELLKKHNDTISQYIENLKLGVVTGMVRSVKSCKAGINALKRRYYDVAVNNALGILKEGVAISILADSFTAKITQEMNSTWYKRREESVRTSLKRFLLLYLGEPLHRLLRYLETEHLKYCYEEADGMAKLPLKSVYINGFPDRAQATSGKLPNGDVINATKSYTKLLSFFTSGVISPEELRQMGNKKLKDLLEQAKKIARQYTGIQEDNTAVVKFKQDITSRDMFFNDGPFPVNESSEDAYMKCYDTLGALNHCPERWKALERWVNSTKEVAKLLKPKIKSLFYDTGPKKTTPQCGISVKGEYNPDVCFHGYEVNFGCVTSAYQTLPFFMNSHGPKYTQYTTVSHEQLPGHHLEVQGFSENFGDSCRDAISWISDENYLPSFTEGWATYVEYPLMVEDTDAYSNTQDKQVLLQKYGMLKYQILAALRSVLDTGVNYFGMTRHEAMVHYDEYAWDNSDLAIKDITRYQSSPGTVVSYMIGQETFARLRKQAEKELGSDFSLKEFHYQVLRQGELPLKYLEIHITRFIACKKDSSRPGCEEILS